MFNKAVEIEGKKYKEYTPVYLARTIEKKFKKDKKKVKKIFDDTYFQFNSIKADGYRVYINATILNSKIFFEKAKENKENFTEEYFLMINCLSDYRTRALINKNIDFHMTYQFDNNRPPIKIKASKETCEKLEKKLEREGRYK